jgi:hypothetical protein
LGIGDWGLGIGDWAQSPIPIDIRINLYINLKNINSYFIKFILILWKIKNKNNDYIHY